MTVKVYTGIFILGHQRTLKPTSRKTGRAGSGGKQGVAFVVYQGILLTHVEKVMKQYVKTDECRRKALLKNFVNGNNVPSTAPAATLNSTQPSVNSASTLISTQQPVTSAATLNSTQPSVSSAATLNSTQPSLHSASNLIPTQQPVSSAGTLNSTQPSVASASTLIPTQQPVTSAATLNSTQPSVSSAATLNSTQPSVASAATANARQPSPVLQIDLLGANIGNGVMEWYFPWNMSQSTIDNRNGSNACVFIAFNFGLLYKQFSLDNTLVGENLNSHWQTALEHAIRAGNDIHDQLFDFEGVNVSVEEGIELAGEVCQVGQVLRE